MVYFASKVKLQYLYSLQSEALSNQVKCAHVQRHTLSNSGTIYTGGTLQLDGIENVVGTEKVCIARPRHTKRQCVFSLSKSSYRDFPDVYLSVPAIRPSSDTTRVD